MDESKLLAGLEALLRGEESGSADIADAPMTSREESAIEELKRWEEVVNTR